MISRCVSWSASVDSSLWPCDYLDRRWDCLRELSTGIQVKIHSEVILHQPHWIYKFRSFQWVLTCQMAVPTATLAASPSLCAVQDAGQGQANHEANWSHCLRQQVGGGCPALPHCLFSSFYSLDWKEKRRRGCGTEESAVSRTLVNGRSRGWCIIG